MDVKRTKKNFGYYTEEKKVTLGEDGGGAGEVFRFFNGGEYFASGGGNFRFLFLFLTKK